jgi:flavodoxin
MKTLIVYASVHHMNTEKVAKVIAEELGADLVPVGQAQLDTSAYDLIGFGQGFIGGRFIRPSSSLQRHSFLSQENRLLSSLPVVTGK